MSAVVDTSSQAFNNIAAGCGFFMPVFSTSTTALEGRYMTAVSTPPHVDICQSDKIVGWISHIEKQEFLALPLSCLLRYAVGYAQSATIPLMVPFLEGAGRRRTVRHRVLLGGHEQGVVFERDSKKESKPGKTEKGKDKPDTSKQTPPARESEKGSQRLKRPRKEQ